MTPPSRRETLVFRSAVAVALAHVVADAFLLLEPGASRREHVAWAAVALAGGVLAAWRYPHLRPGLRAALALVFGFLALVAGGAAAAGWAGLLLLPAGAALVLLGAAVLWSSRRRGGRVWLRRGLIAVGAVLAAYWILLPIALAWIVTHGPRDAVEAADLARPYEEVSLPTSDGLRLAGWYVPSENGAAVLVFPGRSGTVDEARVLAQHGYGVLLLDRRGQDESEGDPNAFGWDGTEDVAAAVAWLAERPDVEDERIGGLGLSVGGELILQAAAEGVPLQAVVSEGAGTRSVREELIRGPAGWPSLPTAVTLTAATALFSWDAPPPSLEELAGRIAPTPILLVYAGRGQGGEDLNPEYFEAAGEPKELWEIPEAGHTGGLEARPREYEERVVGFLDRALLDGS